VNVEPAVVAIERQMILTKKEVEGLKSEIINLQNEANIKLTMAAYKQPRLDSAESKLHSLIQARDALEAMREPERENE